jgi:acetylornithine deacetylase
MHTARAVNPGKIAGEIVALLRQLIATPSFSREEDKTALLIGEFFWEKEIPFRMSGNNIWAKNRNYDPAKKTLLLNSHHDTVKPVSGWTKDPFGTEIENGKLFGLGSNDAGGALCALIGTFVHFFEADLPFNLVLAATAEEEISGKNGIESILPQIGKIDFAIVGEPTQLKMAIAEKGLLVVDCETSGISGHAARGEGENAIYKALPDLLWFRDYEFNRISPWLGKTTMQVTLVNSGTQHNIVPDRCSFTVDIRLNECYTHEEILSIIGTHVRAKVTPRSMRLRPSFTGKNHPLVLAGEKTGIELFGSVTLSDQALLPFPSVKIGPGDSARSHTADEFIFLEEIGDGIKKYIQLLEALETVLQLHS